MKKRIYRFAGLVVSIIVICIAVVLYVELKDMQLQRWESKAIFAQAQASIIEAQAQLVVNKAVAFQLYTNSLLLIVLSIAPLVLAIVLLTILIYRWLANEKVQ